MTTTSILKITTFLFLAMPWFASAADAEWPLFGGNNLHQRHSPSTQINKQNVEQLQLAWQYNSGIEATFQATPIVRGGVMYLSLPFNDVAALDAKTGREIWRYRHDRIKERGMCCGPANRGVAVSADRVFMGTVDGRLLALDAETGEKLWDKDVTEGKSGIQEDIRTLAGDTTGEVSGTSGAGLNMAPMVYKGKVIIGITGVGYGLHLDSLDSDAPLGTVVGIAGKYGRRGFLAAYDMETGEQTWQFDTIPEQGWEGDFVQFTADGVRLPRDIEAEKSSADNYADAWRYGGGSAWSTPAIDYETDTLFFGTGNPSPQMEGSSRPGDNLYTSSLVALDANSGELKWYFQQVPHDMWGYDVASPPVLFTAHIDGESIPAIGQAGKTGWFYVLNRENGALLFKSEAYVPQQNMFQKPSKAGTIIYPGVLGGSNWSPVSVDEQRRLVFIAGIHWPVEYSLHQLQGKNGKPGLQYSSMSPLDTDERYGLLSAIDIDNGKLVWQHKTPNPLLGGVLSTASGLVFSGEGSGELFALDAATGEKLWSGQSEAGVNAPPISYEIDGRQYIAVASGGNKLFGYQSGDFLKVWTLP
ncbi:pyrroloquinoline quinone-dependent dehydrogenase [Methylophaga sp. OBS4]|uniref:pyrroloquinoline quinone-dependent dehydrogenase n=1 Tax=Methylophaga sp. OBS4 TaxID=2991935 RepID=UPI002251FF80|nr:PQQ-binding-like beta-propeller repeat protein [Methylophaga sp. OBS4]MCX4186470.1 PQQ-binding-like beta-propeller repeat protein [Methylophaga sp. OBS4]